MSNKKRNIFLIFSVFLVLIVATGCAFASDSDSSTDDSTSASADTHTTADVSQVASDTSSSDVSSSSSSQSSSADTSSATDTSSSSSSHSSSTTTKDTSSVSTTSKDVSSTSTSSASTTTKDTTSSSTSSQATQTVKDTDNSVKAQQTTTEKTLKTDDDDGTFTELNTLIQDSDSITLDKNYVRGEDESIIDIAKDVTIDGNGYTIDVNQQYGAFNITSSANVVMSNVAIVNDYYNVSSMYDMDAGTIQVDGASLTLNNVTMSNNTMRYGTGCILITSGGNVEIYDSSFTNNYGMYGNVIETNNGTLRVNNTEFINNSGNNGAVYVHNSSDVVNINNSKFENNYASNYGGAIQVYRGLVNVYNTEFINNTADTKGGAIYQNGYDYMTIENCVFTDNKVIGTASNMGNIQGGAIAARFGINLKNNTMSGNEAYNGSTILLDSNGNVNPTYITIEDVTVASGEVPTLTAYVTDDMGNAITGGYLIFTVNGEEYDNDDVIEGVATCPLDSALEDGTYTITAEYTKINASTTVVNLQEGTLTVEPIATGSFTELAALIDSTEDTLTLTQNYARGIDEDNITISKDITIDGNGYTISANNQTSAFTIAESANVVLENMIISDGYTSNYDANALVGVQGTLTLRNVTMKDSYYTGSAVLLTGTSSTLNVYDSTFIDSYAQQGAIRVYSTANINNTLIQNISSANGAVYAFHNNVVLTINNTQFINNYASNYGAALDDYRGVVEVYNSEFINNTSKGSGGAVYHQGNKYLTIENCIFTGNAVEDETGNGGAISSSFGLNLKNNTMSDNKANGGLDIYLRSNGNVNPTYITVEDVTVLPTEIPTLTAQITDDNGNTITGGTLTFTVNGETYTADVLEGFATVEMISTLENGVYEITATYSQVNASTTEVINKDGVLTVTEPSIYVVYEDNFYDFFNEDGTVNKGAVIADSELQFAGTITDKVIVLDMPLNLTSYEQDPVNFKNLRIDVTEEAQGSNITNLVIENTDYSEYVIGIIDTADITVEGNTITMTNQEGKTRTIYINGSVNNKIIDNTITTYGPSDDIDYAMMTGFANTMSIMVYNSSYNVIDNNVITTGYTTTSGRYGTCTIVGVGIYGDYTFDWSTFRSGYLNASYNNITNNVITTTGYNYTYGIDLLYGAYYSVVENNTITTTSNLYSAGVQVSGPGTNIKITNNTIDLKADNITYGIILQSVYGTTSDNEVTYNTITTESSTTYLIELYISNYNNISYNDLKSENANAAMGIGLSMSGYNDIEYNTIDVSGTNDKTPYPGDYIQAKNTGIGLYTSSIGNTITNNNVQSTVGTGDCYAVDLNTTTLNTVTGNYLVSTGYAGDDSVFSTSDTNTIRDNEPYSAFNVTVDGTTVKVTIDVGTENDGYIVLKANGKTLKDENGNTITVPVEDGVASYEFTLNASSIDKDYEISYVYSGSAGILRGSQTITISPQKATVTVDAIDNAKAGQTVTLTAHITDSNGKAITTGKLIFKLNGKTLKDENGNTIYGYVDENGDASITYTLPDNYSAKDYVLTAVFQGSGFERAEANSTLTIVKTTPTIVPDETVFGSDNKITITQGTESVQIKATINDPETNAPIDTTTVVTIKINNKTVTQQYVNDGQIDMTIYTSSFKNPEYTITVVVGENSLYERTSYDATLEIVTPTSLATENSYNGTLLAVTPVGLEISSSYNGTIEAKD